MKMDKRQNLELIADISNANGAPGFEDDVVAQIRRHAEGLGELREDSLRNLYIYRKENKGNRPVVQLDGHSDEVAFMVQAIRPDGNLRICLLYTSLHSPVSSEVCSEPLPAITAAN